MSAQDKTITLQEAIDWTGAYRSSPSTAARAFLIPMEDLIGVYNEIKDQGGKPCARAYLAMDGNVEKLVFVGTSQDAVSPQQTIYRDLLPAAGDAAGAGTNKIYDFTHPCPPDCDPTSPLN